MCKCFTFEIYCLWLLDWDGNNCAGIFLIIVQDLWFSGWWIVRLGPCGMWHCDTARYHIYIGTRSQWHLDVMDFSGVSVPMVSFCTSHYLFACNVTFSVVRSALFLRGSLRISECRTWSKATASVSSEWGWFCQTFYIMHEFILSKEQPC